uniref:Macrophage-expressed 1 protein n=1 Tax=Hemiscolopendra marginata TaxID=943146 RepID=A0A646QF49_9MYRI
MIITFVSCVLLILGPRGTTVAVEHQPGEKTVEAPPSPAKCFATRKMEVLPGRGWDNLRNKDMGQVLEIDYSDCKTTEDGLFLMPNNVHASAIKQSDLQLTSELIDHWTNYTSITAQSFKTNEGAQIGFWSVEASFSAEYQNAKQHQVEDKSQTTRVQLRNTMYSVQASPASKIEPNLKKQILEALKELEAENTEKADVILELIVRDYGTHYITQAEAGAVLVQEDFITTQFIQDHESDKSQITAAAGVSFLDKFGFGVKYSYKTSADLLDAYMKSQTSSSIMALGGSTVTPNMSVEAWSRNLVNNLVMTDRFGDPLSYLIVPEKFENISLVNLGRLRNKMEDAIKRYYSFNTHLGCVSLDSPNFDYTANVDDGSCKSPINNYTFGGVYQTCSSSKTELGDLCQTLSQKNLLTGDYSCPTGYQTIPLYNGIKNPSQQDQECHDVCSGWWIFKSCHPECNPITHQSLAEYASYWCVAMSEVPPNTGYMFGGLYTSIMNNPVMKSQSCPPTYLTLELGSDLKICASDDYELGGKYQVPFAGFFSCSEGNPLVTSGRKPFTQGCPGGYSQHVATIENYCEIHYCVKANAFGGLGQITVIRPPFTDISHLYMKTSPLVMMSKAERVDDNLSGGSIAAIVISCMVALIVIGIGAIIMKRRKSHSRENNYNEPEVRQPLLQQEDVTQQNAEGYGSVNSTQPELSNVHCEI